MKRDARDRGYSYEGKITTKGPDKQPIVIDVAGYLYARNRSEAEHQVTRELQAQIQQEAKRREGETDDT